MREQTVNEILKKYVKVDFEKERTLRSENLLGHKIGIEPRNMLEIYVEFKSKCEQESLIRAVTSGKFKTYNDFLELPEKKIDKNE